MGMHNLPPDLLRDILARASYVGPTMQLPQAETPPSPPKRTQSHTQGEMNKTESSYARWLDMQKAESFPLSQRVAAWVFEGLKLELARRTWYTPDFLVYYADGRTEVHEVKGYWRDDARVKIKVAAEKYWWWRFLAVKKAKNAWELEVLR